MFSTAPVTETLVRTYFESQGRRIYAVQDVLRGIDRVPAMARLDEDQEVELLYVDLTLPPYRVP
jgi:hypothetical protein